jgi:hypothetical protein
MPTTNLNSGLQAALSLFKGGRNALSSPLAYGVSNKDYMNHMISRNILSKAAQLVNDLEDARAAQRTFQNLMAQPAAEPRTTATPFAQKIRGILLDRLG